MDNECDSESLKRMDNECDSESLKRMDNECDRIPQANPSEPV